jgi:hypothetical protein
MHMQYVNYAGAPVRLDSTLHAKAKLKRDERSFHNGWRVVGIPAGAMEEAQKERAAEIRDAINLGATRIPKDFDEIQWRQNFKKKPIRSKPYEIPAAAEACKQLAEKAGWTYVEILEIKKEVRD